MFTSRERERERVLEFGRVNREYWRKQKSKAKKKMNSNEKGEKKRKKRKLQGCFGINKT